MCWFGLKFTAKNLVALLSRSTSIASSVERLRNRYRSTVRSGGSTMLSMVLRSATRLQTHVATQFVLKSAKGTEKFFFQRSRPTQRHKTRFERPLQRASAEHLTAVVTIVVTTFTQVSIQHCCRCVRRFSRSRLTSNFCSPSLTAVDCRSVPGRTKKKTASSSAALRRSSRKHSEPLTCDIGNRSLVAHINNRGQSCSPIAATLDGLTF
jgi:hypothetical protein